MSSALGERGRIAMRALGNALGIIDAKMAPGRLKTDELIPVIAADAGWSSYELISVSDFGNILAGTGIVSFVLTGETDNPGDPALLENNAGFEVLILGFLLRINFSASGAAAFAGKYINVSLNISLQNNFITISQMRRVWTVSVADPLLVVAANMYTDPASDGGGYIKLIDMPLWIPAGVASSINVYAEDGSTFPAGGIDNTAFSMQAFGVKVPKGVKPPFAP